MTRQQHANRINACWRKTVESILDTASYLIEAEQELGSAEFKLMVEQDLEMSASTARKIKLIGRHPVLSQRAYMHNLPACWGTLYELSKLDAATLLPLIEDGTVSPKLEEKQALALRDPPRRTPLTADPVTDPADPETVTVLAHVMPPTGPDRVTVRVTPLTPSPYVHPAHHDDAYELPDLIEGIFNGGGNGSLTLQRRIEALADRNADSELRRDVIGTLEALDAKIIELLNLLRTAAGEVT
jgi:hypothetical protein